MTGACGPLHISWDEGWGIKARAVKRGLARRGAELVNRVTGKLRDERDADRASTLRTGNRRVRNGAASDGALG